MLRALFFMKVYKNGSDAILGPGTGFVFFDSDKTLIKEHFFNWLLRFSVSVARDEDLCQNNSGWRGVTRAMCHLSSPSPHIKIHLIKDTGERDRLFTLRWNSLNTRTKICFHPSVVWKIFWFCESFSQYISRLLRVRRCWGSPGFVSYGPPMTDPPERFFSPMSPTRRRNLQMLL